MLRSLLAGLLSLALGCPPALLAADADRAVAQRLQTRIARSALRADTVSVRVDGGVAVLEGSVANVQRKGLASRFAKEAGANRVVNLLKVNGGRPQDPIKVVRVLP